MSDVLPFVLTGLVTGMLYGLAATGLVLTFKTSGIFNFGHGAILTATALLFYGLHVSQGWDWKLAAFLSVAVAGPLLGLLMEVVARHLAQQSTAMKIVGTVGFTVLVPALTLLIYPKSKDNLKVPRFLPLSNRKEYKYRVFGANLFGDQLLTAGIAVVAVGVLYALFRYTRLGSQMRAAVDDPDLLDLMGTSPVRVRRIAWMVGCTFAAMSGVLIVPIVGLQPLNLTFLATYAFGAAAIGGFTSIPLTFLGALLIGVGQDVVGYVVNDQGWTTLGGLSDALPFVVLFIALLALPKNRLSVRSEAEHRPPLYWQGPIELRAGVGVLVIAGLLLVPQVAGSKLPYFAIGLCQATLMLSLGLLVKTSGQVSLCHATFAAIGATAFSQFTVGVGLPWLVALLLAGLVAVPVGAVVALPAIRLHGVYLALATFGFGILVQRLLFPQSWMFFTFAGGRKVSAPFGSTDAQTRYYTVMVTFIVVAVIVLAISQSRLGRVLRGLSGAPDAVSTLGLSTSVTKVIVFCISAFLASVSGVMFGVQLTNVDGGTQYFNTFYSLVLVTILALAPFREPWYAVFAGFTAVIPGLFSGDRVTDVMNLLFGCFAIVIALQGGQRAMAPGLRQFFSRFGRQRAAPTTGGLHDTERTHVPPGDGLEVIGLGVRFGGLRAVDGVDLRAPLGRITGLIGPNGAGKTTTFNACSGINRNVEGRILLKSREVSGLGAPARARLGLGRTFQRMELCDSLTVFENVCLGDEAPIAGSRVFGQIAAPPGERRRTIGAAAAALELCDIAELAGLQAGALSMGQRRLVELARCLAGPFDLLLLDEPSSGLDREETARFADVLTRVVDERGCGILLVEHDMALVMKVCSYIYVLDFGRLIFEGSPSEVAQSEIVRSAYLGSEADALVDAARGVE